MVARMVTNSEVLAELMDEYLYVPPDCETCPIRRYCEILDNPDVCQFRCRTSADYDHMVDLVDSIDERQTYQDLAPIL